MDRWQTHRLQLRRRWWVYMLTAMTSSLVFIWCWQTRDPYLFAITLLVPLLALRQAWRIDREIRNAKPIISTKEIS